MCPWVKLKKTALKDLPKYLNSIEHQDVPNSFNNYFTGIANQLTTQLPSSNHTASSYLRDRINNTFLCTQ